MKALARLRLVFLVWENSASETDLMSKFIIIQIIMTTLGYFKSMSCRISSGLQSQGRQMFAFL